MEQKFSERVEELTTRFSRIEKPDGSKAYPARTCRDLHANYPLLKSGKYWIDPNMGCKEDAVEVECKFEETKEDFIVTTCIAPKEKMAIEKSSWATEMKSRAQRWFVEEHELGNFAYNASPSQLRYLSYLSRDAYQTVTVHCHKYTAWYDDDSRSYKNAMRFLGTEEQEFQYFPTDDNNDMSRFTPEVIKDKCSSNSDTWEETVLKFTSHKFIRLPVIDVAPTYPSEDDSKFGVELGPVCFN